LFVESLFQNQKLKTHQRIELVILVSNDCRIANVRWCCLTDVLQGLPMDGMVAISSGQTSRENYRKPPGFKIPWGKPWWFRCSLMRQSIVPLLAQVGGRTESGW